MVARMLATSTAYCCFEPGKVIQLRNNLTEGKEKVDAKANILHNKKNICKNHKFNQNFLPTTKKYHKSHCYKQKSLLNLMS